MSKPKIIETIGGYLFTWEDMNLSISTNRIRVHTSDGRVTGELLIKDLEGTILYPQTSFNFNAERTRNSLVKTLSDQDSQRQWGDIINQLSVMVIDKARQGEPVIELTTIGDVKPPEYILHPLIVKNYPNVIFGDPSSAKSTIATVLAQVIMLPWGDNPMGLIAPKESIKVLYLDWETDADTIQWQTTMLQRGIDGMGFMSLPYRQCSQPLANDIEQIKSRIADAKAKLIIIDSQGLAAGGELKETQSALGFYAALRGLKTTSLILAHNSKDRETKTRSIYGNQFFTAQARNVWEVRKNQEADSKELDIALFHRKPPPFAGLHKPLGFKIIFDTEAGRMNIRPSDPKTVGEFLEQMGLKSQILEALKSGSMTVKELSDTLEKPANQVKARCNDLKGKGKLVKMGENWGLSHEEL